MEDSPEDLFPMGWDTEGAAPDTLQLSHDDGRRITTWVIQLNKVAPDNKLPPILERIISHPKSVFTGKNVEQELLQFFEKYQFSVKTAREAKFVEGLTLFRLAEALGRGGYKAAATFCKTQVPFFDEEREKGIFEADVEDWALRFLHRAFCKGEIIEKPYDLRNPNLTDWSLRAGS